MFDDRKYWGMVINDPQKFGYIECPHCGGCGTSLKDPPEEMRCTQCFGYGMVKETANDRNNRNQTSNS